MLAELPALRRRCVPRDPGARVVERGTELGVVQSSPIFRRTLSSRESRVRTTSPERSRMDAPKPPLLFLGQALPYPQDSGVAIRTAQAFRMLSSRFDVDALFFYRNAHTSHGPALQTRTGRLRSYGRVETFPIPQENSHGRFALDHLRSLATGRPYTYYAYDSAAYHAALDRLTRASTYEIVHLDSLDLVRYAMRFDARRVACTHHNVESDLLRRRARRDPSPLRRLGMRLQVSRVAAAEAAWCPRFGLNIAVSEGDAAALREIAPGARVEVVPNGVEAPPASAVSEGGTEVLFVGGTSWFPNRDALEFFGRDVLPTLRERHPDVTVRWVGRCSGEERRRWGAEGLDLTGYVNDVAPHYADAACVVVPLRLGGGTRLKILEAWAYGKAVVSTTVGCEGLDARHDANILIADDPQRFVECVSRVLGQPDLRARLGREGRKTVESRYSWQAITPTFTELYQTLLDEVRAPKGAPSRRARPREGSPA